MTSEVHAHKLLNFLRETPMSKLALKEKALQTLAIKSVFVPAVLKDLIWIQC